MSLARVPSDDHVEPPPTARGRDRRRALVDFATRRFAENGFHPTSVSDIVDGIGVGKGVFYWYFPSKDDLLREILRDGLYDLRRTQHDAMVDVDDPLERLALGIRASLRWYVAHRDLVVLSTFCWTEDTFAPAMRKGRAVTIADIARHLQEAIDRGAVVPADPELLAIGVLGVIDEVGRTCVLTDRPLDDEVEEFAVRMCLNGIVG